MRSAVKVALGIDVTETQMNMVLLKKDRGRLTVLNAVQAPVPEGTIDNGHIVDATKLGKALKAAKRRGGIRAKHVAISLPVAATLARIVPLSEEDPQRIAASVSGEVQQYAALSGRETVSDFRVLTPARHSALGKVLIVATDHKTISGLAQTCRSAGLRVSVIEPAVMACARALRPAPDASPSHANLLLALLKNNTLTVCVFLGGALDFVRTKGCELADMQPASVYGWVADEINAVLQFYGIGGGGQGEGWTITFADEDNASIAEDADRSLKSKVTAATVSIVTQASIPDGIVSGPRVKGAVSVTALGLAMRLLAPDDSGSCVNLTLPEASRVKSMERGVLVAGITFSVLILITLLGMGVLEYMTKQVLIGINETKQSVLKRRERTLAVAVKELTYVEERNELLSGELEYLGRIAESRLEVDWAQLLSDLRAAVPELLRITDLSSEGTSEMRVEGTSHSYESVHVFVQMLNRSAYVRRASIIETTRDDGLDGLVRYAVKCSLSPKEVR